MQVIRAQSAGFCIGVSLALKRLDAELAVFSQKGGDLPHGTRLITLGPIIHNPLVMQHYTEQGVLCENDPTKIHANDRVVIRAHGIPREVEQQLKESGASIVDATCPKVKKAQLAIQKQHEKGLTLVLFGEKDHPEVRGLLSYAGDGAFVFGDLEELEAFIPKQNAAYFLAAQTTQERTLFLQAREILAQKLGHSLPALDTICDATRDRQQEVITMAHKVDAMVVVGGFNSGNTRRLAEVAQAEGLPAVHVESVADLTADVRTKILGKATMVGLTAGASTPDEHIEAMQEFLELLQ